MGRVAMLVLIALLLVACKNSPEPGPDLVPAPEPGTEVPDTPDPPSAKRAYIADVVTKTFHRDDCPELEKLDEGRQRLYESQGPALDDGYAPCEVCRPLRGW
jgi:hypothetical protein